MLQYSCMKRTVRNSMELNEIPISSSFSMRASALCAQSFSTLPTSCPRRETTVSSVFQPSSREDSVSNGRILAVMEANEEIAENSGDPIKTLSALDNGPDCVQGPGPSYGNEGCIGPAGLVSDSCPLGVVLHDEGSKLRKEPEANVVSIIVIKWEESVYKRLTQLWKTNKDEETYGKWQDLYTFRENMRQELGSKQQRE